MIYLLWRGLLIDGPKRWVYDLFSIGLAAALTAVFWLPFIAERNAIRLDVAGPGHFDYHNHFIPLSMLLSPSTALDMGATTPKYIYNLGLVQWLLLIPAAIVAVLRRKSARWQDSAVLCAGDAVLCLSDHAAVRILVGPHPARCFCAVPVALARPGGFHAGDEPRYLCFVQSRAEQTHFIAHHALRITHYVLHSLCSRCSSLPCPPCIRRCGRQTSATPRRAA